MHKLGSIGGFVAILALSFASLNADEPAAPPAKPVNATWQIIAKPSATTLHRSGGINFDVTIKNVSAAAQTIEIRQNFWYAHSDNPAIKFGAWPKNAGKGPVVLFKTRTVAPGESFSHDWTAQIAPDAKLGPATFRVGVTLHRSPADEWSEPVTVEIVGDK